MSDNTSAKLNSKEMGVKQGWLVDSVKDFCPS